MLPRVIIVVLFAHLAFGQDRQDIAEWSAKTGLPVATVHHLWRSASHFADEKDDDSRIMLLDPQSLASRNQFLMVTAAGLPTCLTVTVFSKASGNLRIWGESQTPKKQGFCEHLGIEPEVHVANGKIIVKAPGELISKGASHAEVDSYVYTWTGNTYSFGYKDSSLEFVPAANRMMKRPE